MIISSKSPWLYFDLNTTQLLMKYSTLIWHNVSYLWFNQAYFKYNGTEWSICRVQLNIPYFEIEQ